MRHLICGVCLPPFWWTVQKDPFDYGRSEAAVHEAVAIVAMVLGSGKTGTASEGKEDNSR